MNVTPRFQTLPFKVLLCTFATVALSLSWNAQAAETDTGQAIDLFDGNRLDNWRGLRENHKWMVVRDVKAVPNTKALTIEAGKGAMVNGQKGNTSNLLTNYEHGDCYLHIEFTVPKDSNSGVYFQGLYEIQVLDSYGNKDLAFGDCGGIYARHKNDKAYEGHPPPVNVSKAPGEWQSFDAVFRAPRFDAKGKKTENARFVAVIHNGVLLHTNVELTGNTRASLDKPEAPKGPIMLQGDHGPVAYRNIRLVPLQLK